MATKSPVSSKQFGNFTKGKYSVALVLLALLVPLAFLEGLWTNLFSDIYNDINQDIMNSPTGKSRPGRHLLQDEFSGTLNCTPRSIHQFPPDIMTEEQRKNGGVIFHIFICLYLFVAVAIACDDFFVPSLEKICDVFQIQTDVAGATFMAAGSSAPEFFAAVVGIFFAKSDIGLGTIVGSAVFNLLLVNSVVGIFSGMVIYLTWWPVVRDCTYYAFSVIILIIVMYDELVHWYESLIMVLLYITYVVLMYFNRRAGNFMMNNCSCLHDNRQLNDKGAYDEAETTEPLLGQQTLTTDDLTNSQKTSTTKQQSGTYGSFENIKAEGKRNFPNGSTPSIASANGHIAGQPSVEVSYREEDFVSPLTRPAGCGRTLLWLMMLPATVVMVLTTPDFRRGGCWSRLYGLTFLVSCLWIAVLSYFMVWMVTIAGDTLGIPDTVMGLTLLAIGTSIPDAIASLIVARDGYGDMAVSNSIGSNVFDVLLCLGLPWLIQTAMIEPNSVVVITSRGLTYSTITLLGTIIFLLGGFLLNKWKLNKLFGIVCFIAYVVVVGISCLYELNIFGYFNLPSCPW